MWLPVRRQDRHPSAWAEAGLEISYNHPGSHAKTKSNSKSGQPRERIWLFTSRPLKLAPQNEWCTSALAFAAALPNSESSTASANRSIMLTSEPLGHLDEHVEIARIDSVWVCNLVYKDGSALLRLEA
jgi:hypothetical protein